MSIRRDTARRRLAFSGRTVPLRSIVSVLAPKPRYMAQYFSQALRRGSFCTHMAGASWPRLGYRPEC
jgi:hypothetical protein